MVTYRAVFFDAGETLVHPHPSFAELFALVLHRDGFDVDPAVVADSLHVISERFLEAESDMWTTSPERSRAFWHSVYHRLLEHLGVPNPNGLADRLYGEFTDLSNYRLFPDVEDTIARLRGGGLLLGVVSNFEAWLEQLLESLGRGRVLRRARDLGRGGDGEARPGDLPPRARPGRRPAAGVGLRRGQPRLRHAPRGEPGDARAC